MTFKVWDCIEFIFSLHILLWSILNNGMINFSSAKATKGVPVQLSVIY